MQEYIQVSQDHVVHLFKVYVQLGWDPLHQIKLLLQLIQEYNLPQKLVQLQLQPLVFSLQQVFRFLHVQWEHHHQQQGQELEFLPQPHQFQEQELILHVQLQVHQQLKVFLQLLLQLLLLQKPLHVHHHLLQPLRHHLLQQQSIQLFQPLQQLRLLLLGPLQPSLRPHELPQQLTLHFTLPHQL